MRGRRHDQVAAVQNGLIEAIDARLANGMSPDAVATAIAESGDPDTIARSFALNRARSASSEVNCCTRR